MKGITKVTTGFVLLLGIAALANAEGAADGTGAEAGSQRSFFSRFFSFGFGEQDEEPVAEKKPVVPAEPEQARDAVPAPVTAVEPKPEPARAPASQPEAAPGMVQARAITPGDAAQADRTPKAAELAEAVDAYAVLKRADESRGNLQGIAWKVQVDSREKGRTDSMVYDIKARGFNISGINMAPPKSKGQKLLMLDNNMWFHKPGLSKPIPISLRQKLMGQASYGDVASTNYAEDYEATRLPDETVDGIDCYVFDLRARNTRTTYDRIKYWVDKQRLVGVKADYYTLSGKRFKSANMNYASTLKISGEPRPFISEIAIYEELMSGDVTTLNMTEPRLAPLPDYIFNLNLFMK